VRKFYIIGFVAVPLLILILAPVRVEDSKELNDEELECGKTWAYLTFENVIERALIGDIAVTHKIGNIVYASSYTFGGIHMSEVAANCKAGSAHRVQHAGDT
jgi:hypothetical protein